MIPEIFIQAWRKNVEWQTPDQIEQDLIISRALVDLYNDPHVSEALVFRGGTALVNQRRKLTPPSASKTAPPPPLNMTAICSVNYGF